MGVGGPDFVSSRARRRWRHFRGFLGDATEAAKTLGHGAVLLRVATAPRPASLRPTDRPTDRLLFLPQPAGTRDAGDAMITSAAGIISLLDEEEPELKEFALHKLNAVVNDFWAEISESVDKIEILYEDVGFRSRAFAALVASKVFYHLGAFEESLNYALGAGNLFNVNDNSEYVETIIDQIPKMIKILSGEMAIELHLQFLIRNNNTDLMILKNTKDAVRNSVCHTATVIANSFMHCGTTTATTQKLSSISFLSLCRDNLEWLARATNWAKFTATASLGVIHKGHEKEALQLMATYLPKDTSPGSAYQEGGGLYALGLIHANHGGDIIDYLLNQLKNASNDIVRHGGSLGLGLAAMGTARQDVYDLLKTNLYQDDAVTGLVMLGSKNAQAIEDMVGYAQETQHEKILRGLAVGIALVMYGRMEEADALIESLCRDKDPILRRSGMYTVAMAYCGSGNNKAIRRLLHVAVSDVNDDVRRAAVESLGFILFRCRCSAVVLNLVAAFFAN
ncbi:hypothetical protein JRQ81_017676 [Phrynocephalus forsythii]|uniref:26S proteasome non-ATPase regulatory subunit 1/RPN2 N-terminal domain-containing protein n=1 Tax=Phrynocephalus forsythii TaxID=171643 RepID=A0A9Q1B0E6_9SAUR|nr:hypothetical protein JRQ81_017676 [Phrynocephalus forsythii]